jgi:hypothetical protein
MSNKQFVIVLLYTFMRMPEKTNTLFKTALPI